ncbi:Ankyrin repeat-containing protein, partial [Brazilian cedratvirus IHUMI]
VKKGKSIEFKQKMNSMLWDLGKIFVQTFVKYMEKEKGISSDKFCKQSLALGCSLDHLKTVHELGYPLSGNLISIVLKRKDLSPEQKIEFLSWFADEGIEFISKDVVKAAKENEREVLEWLLENMESIEYTNDDRVLAHLALNGHEADYIDKIKEKGLLCTTEVMAKAALNNDFELLQELHKRSYPMDHRVLSYAAFNDNLEMFVWGLENGLSIHQDSMAYAKVCSPNILNYIMSREG